MECPGTNLPSDIKSDYILIIMIKERKEVTRTTHPYGSNPSPCFSSMYIDREREARSVSHFLSHFFLSAARARQASRKQSRAGTGSTPPQNPLLARFPPLQIQLARASRPKLHGLQFHLLKHQIHLPGCASSPESEHASRRSSLPCFHAAKSLTVPSLERRSRGG
jgi:hypothetical protein